MENLNLIKPESVQNIINKKTWKHLTDKIDEEIQDKRKIDFTLLGKIYLQSLICNATSG